MLRVMLKKREPSIYWLMIEKEVCRISVERVSKAVWIAGGTCRGTLIEAEGKSKEIAVLRWRDSATQLLMQR